MRYLIIGLGIYGTNLARDLTDMGHEVIGTDIDSGKVDAIKDYISTTYIADTTDEIALNALPLRNVDLVIVAIGENFGASIKTVALLKKAKVKMLYARAIDELHESILQGLQVDRILRPEQRAARDLSEEMTLGTQVMSMGIDKTHFVLNFKAPAYFYGMAYASMTPDKIFGLELVAAARKSGLINVLGIANDTNKVIDINDSGERVSEGDVLTVFGNIKDFRKMFQTLNA